MNETWAFSPGRMIWNLQKGTKQKPSEAGFVWKRRCNGMEETWRLHRDDTSYTKQSN